MLLDGVLIGHSAHLHQKLLKSILEATVGAMRLLLALYACVAAVSSTDGETVAA